MERAKRRRIAESLETLPGLLTAAPQVVAARTLPMPVPDNSSQRSVRMELSDRHTKAAVALWEPMFAIGAQWITTTQQCARFAALQWWNAWFAPWLRTYARDSESPAAAPVPGSLEPGHTAKRRRPVGEVSPGVAAGHKRRTRNVRVKRTKKREPHK
jgi:hypothetical protein